MVEYYHAQWSGKDIEFFQRMIREENDHDDATKVQTNNDCSDMEQLNALCQVCFLIDIKKCRKKRSKDAAGKVNQKNDATLLKKKCKKLKLSETSSSLPVEHHEDEELLQGQSASAKKNGKEDDQVVKKTVVDQENYEEMMNSVEDLQDNKDDLYFFSSNNSSSSSSDSGCREANESLCGIIPLTDNVPPEAKITSNATHLKEIRAAFRNHNLVSVVLPGHRSASLGTLTAIDQRDGTMGRFHLKGSSKSQDVWIPLKNVAVFRDENCRLSEKRSRNQRIISKNDEDDDELQQRRPKEEKKKGEANNVKEDSFVISAESPSSPLASENFITVKKLVIQPVTPRTTPIKSNDQWRINQVTAASKSKEEEEIIDLSVDSDLESLDITW